MRTPFQERRRASFWYGLFAIAMIAAIGLASGPDKQLFGFSRLELLLLYAVVTICWRIQDAQWQLQSIADQILGRDR
jgi:hypothetical protein